MSHQCWNYAETMLCNVGKQLHRRCPTLIQRCFNIKHYQDTTSDFVSFSTSDQVLESLFLQNLRKKVRETTKGIVYRNGSQFKRLYGIVIRIYKLSSVCLPHCIYFVLFVKLKQCANWYKSQLSDGFTRKLLGLQLTYSHIRITLLQSTIMTFSGRFPKYLCSSIAIIFNNLVTKFLNVLNCCGKKRVALVFMTQKFFV